MTRKSVVEVRRSQRRRRTVSAYRDGERIVVLIPAQFSRAEEREWVNRMLERINAMKTARLFEASAKLGAIASGAKIAVYFAPNTDQGFLDAITSAVHDNLRKPSVVSILATLAPSMASTLAC